MFTANKCSIFPCDFNYVTPEWSKETACCSGKRYSYLAWRNSTFRKYVVKFSILCIFVNKSILNIFKFLRSRRTCYTLLLIIVKILLVYKSYIFYNLYYILCNNLLNNWQVWSRLRSCPWRWCITHRNM